MISYCDYHISNWLLVSFHMLVEHFLLLIYKYIFFFLKKTFILTSCFSFSYWSWAALWILSMLTFRSYLQKQLFCGSFSCSFNKPRISIILHSLFPYESFPTPGLRSCPSVLSHNSFVILVFTSNLQCSWSLPDFDNCEPGLWFPVFHVDSQLPQNHLLKSSFFFFAHFSEILAQS